jgi:hypothetical protein
MAVPSELTVSEAPQHDRPAPAVSTQLTAAPRPSLFSLIRPEETAKGPAFTTEILFFGHPAAE